MLSFREAIEKLQRENRIKKIRKSFSPRFELPKVASTYEPDKAKIFTQLEDYEDFRALTGLYTESHLLPLFNLKNKRELLERILNARRETISDPYNRVNTPPVQEKVIYSPKLDFTDLPIPTFYPQDKGPYITAGVVLAQDPDYGLNASYHRMTPVSSTKLVARVVKRDLWTFLQRAKKREEKLEAAIVLGGDAGLAIASAISPPIDKNEVKIGVGLTGKLDVSQAETLDMIIPSRAEIIIEGNFLPEKTAREGPFVDISGTYDKIREQPIFQATCITMRENPIFHIVVPSGIEHKTLMGLPKEAEIFESVSNISLVKNVNLTQSGSGWLDAIIAIEKQHTDKAINAGFAAFTGHSSLKRVIIVDPDIDVHNMEEVQWAVLTRAHPAKDYLIIPRARGSSLDHTGKKKGKLIIDATIKGEPRKFKRRNLPSSKKVEKFIQEKNEQTD